MSPPYFVDKVVALPSRQLSQHCTNLVTIFAANIFHLCQCTGFIIVSLFLFLPSSSHILLGYLRLYFPPSCNNFFFLNNGGVLIFLFFVGKLHTHPLGSWTHELILHPIIMRGGIQFELYLVGNRGILSLRENNSLSEHQCLQQNMLDLVTNKQFLL